MDDALKKRLNLEWQRGHQRIHADMPGVAHPRRSAEHRHRHHQQQRHLFDIGRGIVEHVAQNNAIDDDGQ